MRNQPRARREAQYPAQLTPAESLRVRDKRQMQDSHSQAAAPQNPVNIMRCQSAGHQLRASGGSAGLSRGQNWPLGHPDGIGLAGRRRPRPAEVGGLGWSPEGAFIGCPCPAPGGRACVSFLCSSFRSCSGTPKRQPSSYCREVPAGPVK